MITYSDFITDFPDPFADTIKYSQARVERAIARAATEVDPELDQAEVMVGFLAAHYLSIATPGMPGGAGMGAISSLSVSGEYTVSYASRGGEGKSLETTSYGAEFLRILNSQLFTPVIV